MEMFIKKVIEEKNASFLIKATRVLLLILSIPFMMGVFLKNFLYSIRVLKEKKTDIPLICVGNIVAGGVGKTPFVEMFVKDIGQEKVAVLSRGYKSLGASKSEVIRAIDPGYSGDEAFLLQNKLPKALVLVCKKRQRALEIAKKQKMKIAVSDDGMQQRSLKKECLITLISAKHPFGWGYFLPRGYLREPKSALARADFLCITEVESEEQFDSLKKILVKYTSARIMGGKKQAIGVKGQKDFDLCELVNKKVGAFCGLGNPEQFFQTLKGCQVDLIQKKILGDHEKMEERDLIAFASECKMLGAECILCSEKDYVKLELNQSYPIPVCFLQVVFKVEFGRNEYHDLVGSTLNLISETCEATI